MKSRCYNPNEPKYAWYGGKGINVCPRWLESPDGFRNFCEDMGPRPSMDHTIDRRDGADHYTKENCQWLTWDENRRKRRPTVKKIVDSIPLVTQTLENLGVRRPRIYDIIAEALID